MRTIFILSLLVLTSCGSHDIKQPDPITPPPIVVQPQAPVTSAEALSDILSIATISGAAQYKWKDRNKAPLGYVKGIALAYAQELCYPSLPKFGTAETDALIYYKLPGEHVLNTYAFLMGLGMRESSGRYCEGRDMSASNVASVSAEAGMFQTSYDAGTAKDLLPNFDRKCFLEVFKEGVTCSASNLKNYGTGVGFEFQKKSKECPAFAVKVAADTIRTKRKHYGPINRKEVEFRPEAVELLNQVKEIVKNNPLVCSLL